MMAVVRHIPPKYAALPQTCCILTLLCGQFAAAQTKSIGPTAALQTSRVQLSLGEATLSGVAKSLTSQTGVQIEAVDFLRKHRLIVQIPSTTAADALNLICELNAWTWYEDKAGHIIITRAPPKRPRRIADLAETLGSALPRDWERFLSHSPSGAEPADWRKDYFKKNGMYEDRVTLPERRKIAATLAQCYAVQLIAQLESKHGQGQEIAITALTSGQKRGLINCLVLDTLSTLCEIKAAGKIQLGRVPRYMIEPRSARITLKNGGISVDAVEEINGMHIERGFAASLTPQQN